MFLEAIENISKFEEHCKERKAESENQARQIIQNAEQSGISLLEKVRFDAANEGKLMLQQAESRAAEKAAVIRNHADSEIAVLTGAASAKLEEAAEFIVGRVVNN